MEDAKRRGQMASVSREGDSVCVTGASGYLAFWLIQALLDDGYDVRGTVTDLRQKHKFRSLLEYAQSSPGCLRLYEANLNIPGSFDAAISGCRFVLHLANPVAVDCSAPEKHDESVFSSSFSTTLEPVVTGVTNVFDSCTKSGTVERVVMTSSILACFGEAAERGRSPTHVFTEADWNLTCSYQTPYAMSKKLSEYAAWEYVQEKQRLFKERHSAILRSKDEEEDDSSPVPACFDLVTILPSAIVGPVECTSLRHVDKTLSAVVRLMTGELPCLLDFGFAAVDVRDVALAHVLAMRNPLASNQRYLCTGHSVGFVDFARQVSQCFPGLPVTSFVPPLLCSTSVGRFFVRCILKGRSEGHDYVARNLGKQFAIDNSKIQKHLGIRYRPLRDSVTEMGDSLFRLGLISDQR